MQQSLIEQLRDIHHPVTPATDTLYLSLLLLALMASFLCLLLSIYRLLRNARSDWKASALKHLQAARALEPEAAITRAAIVLRRTVARIDTDIKTHRTTGRSWLEDLDRIFDSRFFRHGNGQLFGDPMYQGSFDRAQVDLAISELCEIVRKYRP